MRLSVWLLLQAVFWLAILIFVAQSASAGRAPPGSAGTRRSAPRCRCWRSRSCRSLFYAAAFFIGLKVVGVDLTGLAVLSGAIGVGLGFGLQKVVSNLVSGVIILLDKSIKPGDVISLGDTFGWITALGARYVRSPRGTARNT